MVLKGNKRFYELLSFLLIYSSIYCRRYGGVITLACLPVDLEWHLSVTMTKQYTEDQDSRYSGSSDEYLNGGEQTLLARLDVGKHLLVDEAQMGDKSTVFDRLADRLVFRHLNTHIQLSDPELRPGGLMVTRTVVKLPRNTCHSLNNMHGGEDVPPRHVARYVSSPIKSAWVEPAIDNLASSKNNNNIDAVRSFLDKDAGSRSADSTINGIMRQWILISSSGSATEDAFAEIRHKLQIVGVPSVSINFSQLLGLSLQYSVAIIQEVDLARVQHEDSMLRRVSGGVVVVYDGEADMADIGNATSSANSRLLGGSARIPTTVDVRMRFGLTVAACIHSRASLNDWFDCVKVSTVVVRCCAITASTRN